MNQTVVSMKLMAVAAILTIAAGCATKLDPVALPATANPVEELLTLAKDLDSARERQVNVLAPDNFDEAQKYLEEGKYRRERNHAGSKVLESVGQARAYLNEAEKLAKVSERELSEAVAARESALKAGARNLPNELAAADRKLMRATARFEDGKGVDIDTRTGLHQTYLDLELKAIKVAKLAEANNILAVVEKRGAKKWVPNTYWTAVQKVSAAEKVINTDRHNSEAVDKAAAEATEQARHTVRVLEIALATDDKDAEAIALELDARNRTIAREQERLSRVASEALNRQQTIGQMQSRVEGLQGDLETTARLDEMAREAQTKFSDQEAEVYRQGNRLLIRLKGMNFPSGTAEIPNASLDTLRKVRELISETDLNSVVIEGHTDAVGTRELNKKLSETRADVVAKYFVAEQVVPEDRVRAVGYGFERPIASNKSREGRQQNRRVDIVINMLGEAAPTQTE